MKFILISPKNRTAYNFRGDLIKEIIARGYEVIVIGPNKDNVEKIEELGARFVEIHVNKNGVNPIEDLRYQKALYKLFMQEKPDVTLGYTSKPVIYGAIAAKKANVPHIVSMVTGVGYAFTSQSKKAKAIKTIMSFLYKKAFNCADKVIFQNTDDKEQFINEGLVDLGKCEIVNGSGVNMQRFHPLPFPEETTFFMLSRIMNSKGVREYLSAAKTVKELHPEVRFLLLGACEGIQDSIGPEELKKYTDEGIITHFGETENVPPYYGKCSVYVLPSYREGTPRTVLEAMATARPIITTDAPGCRETVIDGKTGYLVPVKNVNALAEKILWFADHPEKAEEMGKASFDYCLEKFEVGKVNREMMRICKII